MSSKPELLAALLLLALGFIEVTQANLPYSFNDKTGASFTAKADFGYSGPS